MKRSLPGNDHFRGRQVIIATMHQKEHVIAPLLESALGVTTVVPDHFNTDQFGTFTRDVTRPGTQLEAARAKATAALAHTGATLAIASEGSFSPHPHIPLVSTNCELVILIDTLNKIEIIGYHYSQSVPVQGARITSTEEALETARRWGFPSQGVIVRRSEHGMRDIYKECTSEESLHHTCTTLLGRFGVRSLYIETDMRAHRCPARLPNIKAAVVNLLENCSRTCPQCHTPGFTETETLPGLPCAQCGLPTDQPKSRQYTCRHCTYTEEKPVANSSSDPYYCNHCNP